MQRRRDSRGAVLAEFGPAMVVFVCFVMAPLIDVSFIPVRYLIAQGVVLETAHRLALAEKRSEADLISQQTWWLDFARKCGVAINAEPVSLIVCSRNAEQLVVPPGQAVPGDWLPNGTKAPCVYAMELTADAAIPPLFNGSDGLPGFTAPIHLKLRGRSSWENLARDPATRNFYINE